MPRFSKGIFKPKHPEKYIGLSQIQYKSSWELAFCNFCDTNPYIIKWASESIKIPYRNPLTAQQTVYVPDFLIQYLDKSGKVHIELIEIKPASQAILERVGRNRVNQAHYVKNQAKWAAARAYCRQQGITFRVVCENDLFHTGK